VIGAWTSIVPETPSAEEALKQWDRLSCDVVRVAGAVPPLVMTAHDVEGRGEERDRFQDIDAGHRMLLHQRVLLVIEAAGLL